MKRLSIKMRVTLWYTGIMVLLSGLALAVLLSASNRYIQNNVKNRLEERVFSCLHEIKWDWEDGQLDIDDDLSKMRSGLAFMTVWAIPCSVRRPAISRMEWYSRMAGSRSFVRAVLCGTYMTDTWRCQATAQSGFGAFPPRQTQRRH